MILDKTQTANPPAFLNDLSLPTFDCGMASVMKLKTQATDSDFLEYCSLIERNGYNKCLENTIGENVFVGYKLNDTLIYITYCKLTSEIRIVFDTDLVLPKPAKLLEGRCSITQISLDQEKTDCGMSYVVKCCDGSFFIIDGGYDIPGECDRLYDFLVEATNGGDIVIGGWFVTHAHNDHFGCFKDFLNKYSDKVIIEQIMFNFPSDNSPESAILSEKAMNDWNNFLEALRNNAKNLPIVNLHTGMEFNVRNLHFEVLFTHEDLYPTKVTNFNDTSTVLMMTTCGKKALWLGDIGDDASDVILKTMPEELKCDIVQVAHHGFNGAKTEIYQKADARTIFWPTADYRFDENISRPANTYLLTPTTGRDHIVSGYGTKSVIL